MTIVFTTESDDLIIVTVDSAVTLEFGESREYETGRKSYFYPGVGCVATWGARDQNRVGPCLEEYTISPESHDVDSLADLVEEYLRVEYRPNELRVGEVGYHVAGFDAAGNPKLWRIGYGLPSSSSADESELTFERSDHRPPQGGVNFHYNGRNDLAHTLVDMILGEIKTAQDVGFDLSFNKELVRLSDFIVRFASEITPQVGPPFITHAINSANEGVRISNWKLVPLSGNMIVERLGQLGLPGV